jgi:hypothetical protein
MLEQKNDLDLLFSDAGDFIETRAALWKLKTIDTLADSVSTLVSGLGIISIIAAFVLIVSIGLALLIGDWLGKSYYGFFIIGGIYGIAGLVCYKSRDRWLKDPVGNLLVRKLLKHKK